VGDLAVFSPPSALDRSASDVVLSFAWPRLSWQRHLFSQQSQFWEQVRSYRRWSSSLLITDLSEQCKLPLIRAICVDTPCETVKGQLSLLLSVGCIGVAGEENVECGGRHGVDPQSWILWRNRALVLGQKMLWRAEYRPGGTSSA
jgi:hypothetical protein